jgi:YHS domain-containing protein
MLFPVLLLAVAVASPAVARAQSSAVRWRTNLDAAKLEATQTNRLLLVHFWTNTCAPCKVVEQNVFSQPHVGAALEQDFVPVKIDADASPALARAFRIDRVPTEVVMTPQGNVVASLSVPDKPDAYLTQLQNLARHFRQASAGGTGAGQPQMHSAYAGLPVSAAAAPSMVDQRAAAPQAVPAAAPQVTTNPYVGAPGNTAPYGQAQPVYGQTTPDRYQQAAQSPPQVPAAAPPQAGIGGSTYAAPPTLPNNAMPRSYRNPLADAAPSSAAAGAANAQVAAPPAIAGVTPPPSAPANVQPAPPAVAGPTTPPVQSSLAAQTAPAAGPPTMSAAEIAAMAAAAAPAIKPPQPQVPQLPPGAPPYAFDGCCPVTLKTIKRWKIGDAQFGAIHRGRTYLFAGPVERDQFLADPDAYSPVFAGLDPVLLLDKQQSAPGSRQFGFEYGGSFYLFSCKESMDKFAASPHTYAAGVRQAMSRIDAATGADVIRR